MTRPHSASGLLERTLPSELDDEHPGFRDPTYLRRREQIARLATEHEAGTPPPIVRYTRREREVWRGVLTALGPLHERFVATPMRELLQALDLPRARVPQLAELSARTEAATGFRLVPTDGLAEPLAFLEGLGRREFSCTQYLRHHARPLYTPEPDLVHELVGHVATLLDPRFADLLEAFGRVASAADAAEARRCSRLFWHAVEFGAVREAGEVRAVGAGLLSSRGELASFRERAELVESDLERMAETDYDPTDHQPLLFVAASWDEWLSGLEDWVAARRP